LNEEYSIHKTSYDYLTLKVIKGSTSSAKSLFTPVVNIFVEAFSGKVETFLKL